MTTKTIAINNGKTITVEIVHQVQDKVNYADGYNIVTGREIVDYTRITLRDATGKAIAQGQGVKAVNPRFDDPKAIAAGAVAKIGSAYLRQEMYDLVAGLVTVVEAETPKSDEQIAIEIAQAKAEKDYETWYNSPEAVAARKFEREMNREDSDL